MEIVDMLSPSNVLAGLRATSKKQALQELANYGAQASGVAARSVFEVLIERERLGTTGVGNGIAIPHGKLPGIDRIYGVFAKLERAVDFEAIDEMPVDLVFLILAPEGAGADHLKALAKISRLLRDRSVCEKLRQATSSDALYAILTEGQTSNGD